MTVTWRDHFATGIVAIDDQHPAGEHLHFMENLEKLREKIPAGTTTRDLALRVGRHLSQWLLHHACELDRQFGEFLRDRPTLLQPAQGQQA